MDSKYFLMQMLGSISALVLTMEIRSFEIAVLKCLLTSRIC